MEKILIGRREKKREVKRKGDNKSAVGRCVRQHWGKGGEKKENEGRMGKGNGQGKKMGKIHHKEGREGRSHLHSLHHMPGIHLTPGSGLPLWGGENKILLLEAQSGVSNHT